MSNNHFAIRDRFTRAATEFIRKNKGLYVAARCLKNPSFHELYSLIHGYYEHDPDITVFMIERRGEIYPDKIVYDISFGRDIKSASRFFGFFGLMYWQLWLLSVAEKMSLLPVIFWGEHTWYYDRGMDSQTNNVFEYYFKPVSNISFTELKECKNVIRARFEHGAFFGDLKNYSVGEGELNRLAQLYRKYIHLNDETAIYIEEGINNILSGKRTLGVHVRGTDYYQEFGGHPISVTPETFLKVAQKEYRGDGYDQVFLATEDQNALELFIDAFGDRLVYYQDISRSADSVGPHTQNLDRPLHHYKLGLEVLRDVYTLVGCDGFIGGLSNVGYAVRYIGRSQGKAFSTEIIIDHGVRAKGKLLKYGQYLSGGGYISDLLCYGFQKEAVA